MHTIFAVKKASKAEAFDAFLELVV